MKDHIHMHRNEYPYSCNLCGKKFSQLANKNRH